MVFEILELKAIKISLETSNPPWAGRDPRNDNIKSYKNFINTPPTPPLGKGRNDKYMKKINNKVTKIEQSKTIEIDIEAKRLKALGQKIYNFSAGEPDLEPPKFIKKSLDQSFLQGKTKYGAVTGEENLKEEICQKLKRDNGLSYNQNNIAVTNGCKQALYNIFQCILNEGDEVIIYSPYWVSYKAQVELAGGKVKVIKTNKNFEPDLEKTKEAINNKTRAVIINSPNNPSGAVYSKDKLKELAKLFIKKNIYVICDDVYEKLVYGQKFYSIAQFMKSKKDKVMVVNGISKSHALTGLRVGYVAAAKDIIKLINKLQSQSTGNVCSIAQVVAEDVLKKGDSFVEKSNKIFEKRCNLVEKILKKNSKISFIKPSGAFYYFVNIKKIDNNSDRFCKKLLKEKKIALVPGIAFGMEGYVRISFASSERDLREGLEKFNGFCSGC